MYSRQQKLKDKYREAGLCRDCGKPVMIKPDSTPACRCESCMEKHRATEYKRHKSHHAKRTPNTEIIEASTPVRKFHKCQSCGINIGHYFNFCPWCGAEQPLEDD